MTKRIVRTKFDIYAFITHLLMSFITHLLMSFITHLLMSFITHLLMSLAPNDFSIT
jgi:hypothetical protein